MATPIPYMPQVYRGLGQAADTPPLVTTEDPLWARLITAFGQPFAEAAGSRITYGPRLGPSVTYRREGLPTTGIDLGTLAVGGAILVGVLMMLRR